MSELLFILLVGCTCGMQIVIFFPVARKKQQLVTLSWPDVFSHNMDNTNLTCLFRSYCRDQHIFWTLNVKKKKYTVVYFIFHFNTTYRSHLKIGATAFPQRALFLLWAQFLDKVWRRGERGRQTCNQELFNSHNTVYRKIDLLSLKLSQASDLFSEFAHKIWC